MLRNRRVTSEEKVMNVGTKKKGILKEQFINGINDDGVITEIIRELTAIKKKNEVTREQVLT